MVLGITDFAGAWSILREIDDRLGRQRGVFEGAAELGQQDTGIWLWHERGWITFESGSPMRAERRYLWNARGDRIAILFEDGRPFHEFVPEGSPEATHWCQPDNYRVRYDFSFWPAWQSEWQVRGPRKDYAMVSRFSRV